MKKNLFFAAAAAALALASCSSEDNLAQQPVAQADNALNFGVYNAVASRAENTSKNDVQTNGFGVFAYSTEQLGVKDYMNSSNYTPNFMYNQKVSVDPGSDKWVYSPVKYWPNNPDAKLSFFAYAPYIPEFNDDNYVNTPDNNNILSNVQLVQPYNVRLQLGKEFLGPGIEYIVPEDPRQGIDLLWGCEQDGTTSPVDKLKLPVDETINFMFKHALSRLHFNVQVFADEVTDAQAGTHNADGGELAEGTSIKIDKVELVGKIAKSGTLRLYNGSWNVESGNYADVVFAEAQLNPTTQNITGSVAASEIDLLASANATYTEDEEAIDNFIMLIPNTSFYIRLTYTVTTKDPENKKNDSVVTNTINSTDANVVIGSLAGLENAMDDHGYVTLEAGKAYDFHLNIGMTSVKFAADVEDWLYRGNEIDMPKNY